LIVSPSLTRFPVLVGDLQVTARNHLVHDLDVGLLVAADDDRSLVEQVVVAAGLT
jgi:hypothetical protein